MNAGTLSVTNGQRHVLDGAMPTYADRRHISTNGLIEFANGGTGSVSTVNISGGTLTTTSSSPTDATDLAVRGTTTVTLSGTGNFTTPVLNMTSNQTSGTASGTFNLNGGTLTTGAVIAGTNTGSKTFNFNGGTLQATAGSTAFMTGLTNAFVKSGGAVIDTQTFSDTIGQNLLTDATSTGGGLTKNGTGTLILTGANTYTGATLISAGTLQLGNGGTTGTLSPTSAITDNGTLAFNNSGTLTQGTSFSGSALSGTGGLTQAGTGTTTLLAANTYTGPTLISAGTLQLGNGGTTGTLSPPARSPTTARWPSTTPAH